MKAMQRSALGAALAAAMLFTASAQAARRSAYDPSPSAWCRR